MPDLPQPLLDTRRGEWVSLLAEQVEILRDAAPAHDTRIRLAPDMLGEVDVSIRQEGDRIHVHFAAESAAARQMLSDAQPRLLELAEMRGLKLGQTSVDGGATGQGSPGGQAQSEQRLPFQPPRARASAPADTPSDDRIA